MVYEWVLSVAGLHWELQWDPGQGLGSPGEARSPAQLCCGVREKEQRIQNEYKLVVFNILVSVSHMACSTVSFLNSNTHGQHFRNDTCPQIKQR